MLTIHASTQTVAELTSPTSVSLEPIDDDTCLMRTGAESLDRMVFYLLYIGFEFEVHEPQELIDHVRDSRRQRLQNAIRVQGE